MNKPLSGFLALPGHSNQPLGTGKTSRTWQQAYAQIAMLAALWRTRNIRKLAFYSDNAQDFVVLLLSCVISEVDVCIPANLNHDNQTWLEESADLLICDATIASCLTTTLPVLTIDATLDTPLTAINTDALDFSSDIHIEMQTSGSSGQMKVVQKSWQQMVCEAQTLLVLLADKIPSSVAVTVLSSVSQQHLYGLSFRIVLSLLAGWCIDEEQLQYPEILLAKSRSIANHKIVWISSPTVLHALNEQHNWTAIADNVALVVSAGGMLENGCKTWLADRLACPVIEIYGSTETGAVAYRDQHRYWQFLPSVCCQQNTEQNTLVVSSLWCVKPQHLADSIVRHEQGFELLGRTDRIIKLADKRISLMHMEAHLLQHRWVQDAYIARHPHNPHLVAWVALNEQGIMHWRDDGRKTMISHLKQHFHGWIDRIAWPRYWRFDTVLPRNSQSKLSIQDFQNIVLNPVISPQILQQQIVSEDEFYLKARVPLDLHYFNGHFDHFHLVPAVVQMKWVLACLQQYGWLEKISPRQWKNLKFQRFLRPTDVFTLHFKRDQIKRKIVFQCTDDATKIASGRLQMPGAGV